MGGNESQMRQEGTIFFYQLDFIDNISSCFLILNIGFKDTGYD